MNHLDNSVSEIRISLDSVSSRNSKYVMFFHRRGETTERYIIPRSEVVNFPKNGLAIFSFAYKVVGISEDYFRTKLVNDETSLKELSNYVISQSSSRVLSTVEKQNLIEMGVISSGLSVNSLSLVNRGSVLYDSNPELDIKDKLKLKMPSDKTPQIRELDFSHPDTRRR
ncbi:MAG: hypothetical protein WC238_05775 [Parcubacteria group bacterium]|jgi:hypothetical protein